MKRAPLPSQRKALPEYLKLMLTDVKRERLHKQAMQSSQNGTFVAESTAAPPPELQQDTPPHIVPFPARTLVLNLCPPHGHALLPPPPPKPRLLASPPKPLSLPPHPWVGPPNASPTPPSPS